MFSSPQNRMASAERIREETVEAFRLWHDGKPLTDKQKRLIQEAGADHNLRTFENYLAR